MPDVNDLRSLNDDSIQTLTEFADALRAKKDGLPIEERASVLSTIADIQNRVRVLEFTHEHLEAARIGVEFDPNETRKLDDLAARLDKDILANAQLNAILQSVPAVLDAATQIDAIITGHIVQS